MKLPIFKLEDYLSKYEFTAPYLLCCSDAETWGLTEVLQLATPEEQTLWDQLRLGYTEAPGHPLLRATISHELYEGLTSENILCTTGAEEGIFCTFTALCNPGDHVIVVTPAYQSLLEIPKAMGCEVTPLPLREEQGWRLDLDALTKAIRPTTKWLVMNFPHNPTGQVITPEELNQLIAILDQHDIWLFSDEVYRLLGPSGTVWAKPAACVYPKAISLGVMSKAFGMAGLRVGWVACQDPTILKKIEHVKHYTSICCSGLSEIISLIVLRHKDVILKRNTAIVESNLLLLDRFFKEQAERFSWVRPQGGCIGFVSYQGADSIDTFCERLVQEKGVLLLPASIYDVPTNHFRIGFGRRNMPEALGRLIEFLG